MSKWLKTAFLSVPLLASGYFFGTTCKQVGQASDQLLAPSSELLSLLGWLLLALGSVMVTAGLVVALLRPVWVGFIAFALAGLGILAGWEITPGGVVLVLVFLIAASVYNIGAARELNERIRFSVRPISEGQNMLLMALLVVACGSLYSGFAAHIDREGFSIPASYTETLMEQMGEQVEASVPPEQREQAVAEFREGFQRAVDEFSEDTLKRYEPLIPLILAAGVFTSLVTVTRLLTWLPTAALGLIFRLLGMAGVTRVVRETQEVQRVVIA